MSGFWNYTYCIHCDDLTLIEQTLTRLLEQEGCHRITLPELAVDVEELRQNPWLLCDEVWTFALFVGNYGWTIVKILPEEILCQRAINADHPRLSTLARQIGCNTFYVGLYEYGGILMETDATGDIFISGSVSEEYLQEGKFFDEQINLVDPIQSLEQMKLIYSKVPQRFFLLNIPEQMQKAEQELKEEKDKSFDEWQEQFLDEYTKRYFYLMTPDKLEKWKARFRQNRNQVFNKKGGNQLFRAWSSAYTWHDFKDMGSGFQLFERAIGRLLGGTPSYWYLGRDPLIYRAYTQQKQLEADGAKLLYFRPIQ
ncbi:MAG: hypothetical protein V7K71_31140 [Nostoc sp.]|uniref:hypothetical protein n=1 Tax=Nostoc sp. TaxID=1180 RepID=UPI002FF5CCC6